jgi:hypothetical protein
MKWMKQNRMGNCILWLEKKDCSDPEHESEDKWHKWYSYTIYCNLGLLMLFIPLPWNGRGHIVLPFVIPSFHELVSVHYLLNGCTHLIQIWYMDTS